MIFLNLPLSDSISDQTLRLVLIMSAFESFCEGQLCTMSYQLSTQLVEPIFVLPTRCSLVHIYIAFQKSVQPTIATDRNERVRFSLI